MNRNKKYHNGIYTENSPGLFLGSFGRNHNFWRKKIIFGLNSQNEWKTLNDNLNINIATIDMTWKTTLVSNQVIN